MTTEELEARRQAARISASDDGLDGLVLWSRGGTSLEHYGSVAYLTNHHTTFPSINDGEGWSARGHAVLVLGADGPAVLVTDYLDDPDDRVRVDDVRTDLRIPTAVGRVLAELGLDRGRLGLVGRELVAAHWLQEMEDTVGHPLDMVPADHILERLRRVKSASELRCLRHAAQVGIGWMEATMSAIAEGRTEGDAVGEGLRHLAAHGGLLDDVAIASGPNAQHYWGSSGTPHWNCTRRLERGDMVHVDQWGRVGGYFTDFARSTVVGRRPTDAQREVLEASVALINHIIAAARPGVAVGDLHRRGTDWLADNGFAPASSGAEEAGQAWSAQFPAFGHGLGLTFESPWVIAGEATVLEPNMVMAFEAVVGRPGVGSSDYEQDVVIGADGPEILTAGCPDRWWD